jgi:hypothetical protein
MIYLDIATRMGCAYTAWGPCFCDDEKCKSCVTADKIEELGMDWDEEFNKAELNGFKDPDYI